MATSATISAWIALFIGVYSLGAAIGELRSPGFWQGMLRDISGNDALTFLTGIIVLALGAAIYLVNPWRPDDWLSILITLTGGGMAIEGFLFLAFPGPFLAFAGRLMALASRGWAFASALFGIAIIVAALLRLGTL